MVSRFCRTKPFDAVGQTYGNGKPLGKSAMLINTRCGMPCARWIVPGGAGYAMIRPVRNATARSVDPPTCRIATSLSGSSFNSFKNARAATSDELPTRLMPIALPLSCWAERIDSCTTKSYGNVLMKQPTATTAAPPTAALAVAPPEILPTLTDPAITAAIVVVEEGIKTKSASRPYFL